MQLKCDFLKSVSINFYKNRILENEILFHVRLRDDGRSTFGVDGERVNIDIPSPRPGIIKFAFIAHTCIAPVDKESKL